MQRQQIDKENALRIISKVIRPLALNLGALHILKEPYMTDYDRENDTLSYRVGSKKHGDKRHRTNITFKGITYTDGEESKGKTKTFETDHRVGWSVVHDNRLGQHHEVRREKMMSYEETFNKIRTQSSLVIAQSLTATAQGEIMGFGGSVTTTSSATASTEVETEKFKHTKKESVIEDEVTLHYEKGRVWLIERPLVTLQTVTPVKKWGIWDCAEIRLDLYDWAGNRSIMPRGEHWNVLKFSSISELQQFLAKELILSYPWMEKFVPTDTMKRGIKWLKNDENRQVGPVEYDEVTVNEGTARMQLTDITPEQANSMLDDGIEVMTAKAV